jgi:alpha-D-ribose 1-methylphosphonate 5-triphosphate diphosphatase PhnM
MIMKSRGTIALVLWFVSTVSIPAQSGDDAFVIRSARITEDAAAMRKVLPRFRTADRGRIAPGLRADLLIVEGDPSTEIRATRRIVAVWKRGVRQPES